MQATYTWITSSRSPSSWLMRSLPVWNNMINYPWMSDYLYSTQIFEIQSILLLTLQSCSCSTSVWHLFQKCLIFYLYDTRWTFQNIAKCTKYVYPNFKDNAYDIEIIINIRLSQMILSMLDKRNCLGLKLAVANIISRMPSYQLTRTTYFRAASLKSSTCSATINIIEQNLNKAMQQYLGNLDMFCIKI